MSTSHDSLEDYASALRKSPEYIVYSRTRFYRNLGPYVTLTMIQSWLEAPFYGLINYILAHFSFSVDIPGASFGPHPQSVFVKNLVPEMVKAMARSYRSPDFATLISYIGFPTIMGKPTAVPRLAFWWEVKPVLKTRPKSREDLSSVFFHVLQLQEQARYAFAHYGGSHYYAFISEGLKVSFIYFANPNSHTDPYDIPEASSSSGGLEGRSSRKRHRGDTSTAQPEHQHVVPLPTPEPLFIGQPLLVGLGSELGINPLVLAALHIASGASGATFEPSFLDPAPDFAVPEALTRRAKAEYAEFVRLDLLKDLQENEDDPSSSDYDVPKNKVEMDDDKSYYIPAQRYACIEPRTSSRSLSRASSASTRSLPHATDAYSDDERSQAPSLHRTSSSASIPDSGIAPCRESRRRVSRRPQPVDRFPFASAQPSAARRHSRTLPY
ncbi:hypothetical protein FA95DRAFT_1612041 [Auriscalpium vulgare]|uniref:Uncharacterized protein n=1 Tax=Auriscalpium vulgare TaxID=40419 RepID=A0ACB8R7H9_9AGAM|nr:hypothetical protein FA95DRAFT_1612041 [Auriscalpium vulgare]